MFDRYSQSYLAGGRNDAAFLSQYCSMSSLYKNKRQQSSARKLPSSRDNAMTGIQPSFRAPPLARSV